MSQHVLVHYVQQIYEEQTIKKLGLRPTVKPDKTSVETKGVGKEK
jgi:hypothetical protein